MNKNLWNLLAVIFTEAENNKKRKIYLHDELTRWADNNAVL